MKILLIIIPLALIIFKLITSKADINAEETKELLKNNAKIIDVRSQGEYRSGHIKGSLNIPLESITTGVKKHKISKDTPIILYCASGARSSSAKRFLKKDGFTSVYNGGSLHRMSKLQST